LRYIGNFILLPIRLIIYLYYWIFSYLKKGEHVYVEVPSSFQEYRKTFLLELISGKEGSPLFLQFIEDLRLILESKHIKKVSFNVNQIEYGLAELQEICRLVEELQKKGIHTSGFSQSGDLKTLYFLSFLDERYCAENAEFFLLLPSVESFFFKGTLSKLGIEVENFASGKYKSLAEMFTREKFSKEAKENITSLIQSIKSNLLKTIKKKSNLNLENIHPILTGKYLFDKGFFKGFLDEEDFKENLQYKDYKKPEKDNFLQEPDFTVTTLSSLYFIERKKKYKFFRKRQNKIAIVCLKGEIVEGKREENELKEGSIHAYSTIKMLKEIRKDDSIKGVILEIDSPGGSAFASDLIYREILKLKSTKKTYAYLKNVAASGGYYIALACEKIFTNPYCITGSIGTVVIRPNLAGLYKKLGITKDRIEFYPTREIFSEFGKLSLEAKKFLTSEIERVKDIFYNVVCTNRNFSREDMEQRGGGRVFSGEEALKWKLVDSTSGFLSAIVELEKELGLGEMRWEYDVPTYSIRSMLKSWKNFTRFSKNPLEYVISNISIDRLEYYSEISRVLSKSF